MEKFLKRALVRFVGVLASGWVTATIWFAVISFNDHSLATPTALVVSFAVGAAIAIGFISLRASVRAKQAAAQAEKDQAERDKRHAARRAKQDSEEAAALQREIANWRANALSEAKRGVNFFRVMPEWFENAAQNYAAANRAFADGAFSPFWSSVESAYVALATYLKSVDQIGAASRSYAGAISALADRGDAAAIGLGPFPVELNLDQVASQHEQILSKLDRLVYEAQKVSTFALIWEQRRTTSAIETGFRSLEEAITRMGLGISTAMSNLQISLEVSNAQISQSVDRLNRTTATGIEKQALASNELLHVAREQASTMKELHSQAEAIRDHLYHPEIAHLLHG